MLGIKKYHNFKEYQRIFSGEGVCPSTKGGLAVKESD
jgi:hypothetical protein